MAQPQPREYVPTAKELQCLAAIESVGGKRLWTIAYPIIYRRVTGFGKIEPQDEAAIRQTAKKFDVDLIC